MDLDIGHDAKMHRVRVAPWSRLSTWLGVAGRYRVNSFHHQAVKQIPAGWRVAAESFTGVVEAIEHPHLPVIAVQWRPEQLSDPASRNLFVKFLEFGQSRD